VSATLLTGMTGISLHGAMASLAFSFMTVFLSEQLVLHSWIKLHVHRYTHASSM
jgi:hypothetical protein